MPLWASTQLVDTGILSVFFWAWAHGIPQFLGKEANNIGVYIYAKRVSEALKDVSQQNKKAEEACNKRIITPHHFVKSTVHDEPSSSHCPDHLDRL